MKGTILVSPIAKLEVPKSNPTESNRFFSLLEKNCRKVSHIPKTRTPPSAEKRPDKKLNLEPNNKTMEGSTPPGKPVTPENPKTPPNNPAKSTPEKQTSIPVEPKRTNHTRRPNARNGN